MKPVGTLPYTPGPFLSDAKGGKDAKGKDAKGKDAKGKDATGKDAQGKDGKGKDPGTVPMTPPPGSEPKAGKGKSYLPPTPKTRAPGP